MQRGYNNYNSNYSKSYNNGVSHDSTSKKQPKGRKDSKFWYMQVNTLPNNVFVTERLFDDWSCMFAQPDALEGGCCYVAIDRSGSDPIATFLFQTKMRVDKTYINTNLCPGYWANPFISPAGSDAHDAELYAKARQQIFNDEKHRLSNNFSRWWTETSSEPIAIFQRKLDERENKISVGCATRVDAPMGSAASAWSCTNSTNVKRPNPKRGRSEQPASQAQAADVRQDVHDADESVDEVHEDAQSDQDQAGLAFMKRRGKEIAMGLRPERV